ncbi:hypothetical protein [Nocardia sp. NPDC050710]|uniref:hypothetical protein n=1 Tax=Nocardia sp. NPDC050710 TaxID=3157220 RepID=UPI0033F3DECE
MQRDRLRASESPDGRKIATWRLRHRDCQVLNFQNRADASMAYRWPSGMAFPSALPGLVVLDSLPNLWEVRDAFAGHVDLWDAVRADYWAALLDGTDPSSTSAGHRCDV